MHMIPMPVAMLNPATPRASPSRPREGLGDAAAAPPSSLGLFDQGRLQRAIQKDVHQIARRDEALNQGQRAPGVDLARAYPPEPAEGFAQLHVKANVCLSAVLVASVRLQSPPSLARQVTDQQPMCAAVPLSNQLCALLQEIHHAAGTPGILRKTQLDAARVVELRRVVKSAAIDRADRLLRLLPASLSWRHHGQAQGPCCAPPSEPFRPASSVIPRLARRARG